MKQFVIILVTCIFTQLLYGQNEDAWIRFYDTATENSGYKDLEGNIKIPAKFAGFTRADSFYNIIAVQEIRDSSYQYYYLLKNGGEIGFDSVYSIDFTVDCESENKIIFYDRNKDRVGFLNQNGVAVIPAVYNYVSPFRNGFSVVHQNAKRKCWEENGDTTNCEHLGWEGGETILINDQNEILVDSLEIDLNNINWYSVKVNDPSVDTSLYLTLKGRNNTTYSFVDYDKEFKKWFYEIFLPTLALNNSILNNLLFDEVTFWVERQGWTNLEGSAFLKKFPGALRAIRFETNKLKKISIDQDLFNELIFDKEIYRKYLNACGEHNRDKFPLFSIALTQYKKRSKPIKDTDAVFQKEYDMDYWEQFNFLRTENGYKLLSVSLKK